MKTKKHSATANLKILSGLALLTILLIASVSCNEKSQTSAGTDETIAPPPPPPDAPPPPPPPAYTLDKGDTIWVEVDNLPEFPGGDSALLNYIATNTIYPASAKKNGIQGRVIVSFSVSEDGSVGRSRIVKSVDPEVDAEAIRVINSLPAFEKPAIKNGKPVPVWYMVPITFKLK